MADTGYNGWANWDTWDVYNWLSSDEGAYAAARFIAGCGREQDLRALAEDIIPDSEGIDFGAVDWEEVEEGLLDE